MYTFYFIHKYYYWFGYFRSHAIDFVCRCFVISKIRKFFAKRSAESSLHWTKMMCLIVYYVVSTQRKLERVSHHLWVSYGHYRQLYSIKWLIATWTSCTACYSTWSKYPNKINITIDHRIELSNIKRHTFLLICKRKCEWENSFGDICN